MSALVRHDAARAELAIERLGNLLRFSLDDASGPTVALASELHFTRTYLELERLGLGERLMVAFDVDDSALDTPVPPFSLQTLAENAVRHGIVPLSTGGHIMITIRDNPDSVELIVAGDGPTPRTDGNTGRGLVNLKDRLAASYGTAAQLKAGPRSDGGFIASVTIPKT